MSTLLRGGLDVFGASDVGRVRENNEDHFIIAGIRKAVDLRQTNLQDRSVFAALEGVEAQLLVVADGVGGNAGGETRAGPRSRRRSSTSRARRAVSRTSTPTRSTSSSNVSNSRRTARTSA
jgi:Serine/threonine protein phosphatase